MTADRCPPEETLAEFAQGVLERSALDALAAHLDHCDQCRQTAALARIAAVDSRPAPSSPPTANTVVEGAVARDGDPLSRGARIGRYVIVDHLATGGAGVILRAFDPQLDRRVALKVLSSQPSPDQANALLEEARAAARLIHPNVVTIYDVGVEGSRAFVAMELVEEGSVRRWLRGSLRSPDQILEVFWAAGEGLAAAHRAGLVHRDFKPDNVLIDAQGRPRVADFGLARAAPASSDPDQPASIQTAASGTPGYMAPEQYGGRVDARTDQFAYCVSLWEALTGMRPFVGTGSQLELMRQAPRESALPNELKKSVKRALLRGLSFRAEDRFPSMDALIAELRERRRSQRRLAAVIAVGLAIALVFSSIYVRRSAPTGQPPSSAPVPVVAAPPLPAAPTPTESPPVSAAAQTALASPKRSAHIVLRINPWAQVSLDGRVMGPTPLPPLKVKPGRHVVLLENGSLGFRRRINVDVEPGRDAVVRLNLLE